MKTQLEQKVAGVLRAGDPSRGPESVSATQSQTLNLPDVQKSVEDISAPSRQRENPPGQTE